MSVVVILGHEVLPYLKINRDHSGGNVKIADLHKGLVIYGGDERIPAMTNTVADNDTFKVHQPHYITQLYFQNSFWNSIFRILLLVL